MQHRLTGGHSLRRIADQKLLQKVASFGIQLWHYLHEVCRRVIEGEDFVVRQLRDAWPAVIGGRSEQFKDALQLIVNVDAWEERSSSVGQLGKDAAS